MVDVSWVPFGDIPVWPTLLALTVVLIYVDYLVTFSYFTRLGIPGPRPWPILGHAFHFAAYGAVVTDLQWTQKYGKVYGHYRGRVPFLVVKDPDLLQTILIKDFASFRNRASQQVGILTKKPLDKGLLVLQNNEWKEVRQMINPAFTSGKLKQMFPFICRCAKNLTAGFEEVAESGENVLVKKLFGAYSTDVIAGIGFGLDINSIQDPHNIFIESARKMLNVKLGPLSFLAAMWPSFVKVYSLFGDGLWSGDFTQFFTQTILSTIEERKEDAEKRKRVDCLQLMMNKKADDSEPNDVKQTNSSQTKAKKKTLTVDLLIAQALTFFFAGYETTASTLQFLTYSLAMNPECAEKLHREIDDVLGEDDLTYEALSKLVYLDKCLNETLRLYPSAHTTSRVASDDVKLGKYQIPKGTIIQLPYFGIHHDPETYPQPYTFDPERFSPSAKASRHPLMFSPFGQGPRFCIGMRLALLEAKVATVHVLRKVRLVKCNETPAALNIKAGPFLMTQEPIILQAQLIKK